MLLHIATIREMQFTATVKKLSTPERPEPSSLPATSAGDGVPQLENVVVCRVPRPLGKHSSGFLHDSTCICLKTQQFSSQVPRNHERTCPSDGTFTQQQTRKSEHLATAQRTPINKRKDEQTIPHPLHGSQVRKNQEQTADAHSNLDECQNHYVEGREADATQHKL